MEQFIGYGKQMADDEKNTFLWYPAFLKFPFETHQIYSF